MNKFLCKLTNFDYIAFSKDDAFFDDIKGFFSAGIFLIWDGKFLAIKEERGGKKLYNLIGGKREENENPLITSLREFQEETGIKLEKCIITSYTWIINSKYFIIEMHTVKNIPIPENCKWFPLKNFDEELFHPFAANMIKKHMTLKHPFDD